MIIGTWKRLRIVDAPTAVIIDREDRLGRRRLRYWAKNHGARILGYEMIYTPGSYTGIPFEERPDDWPLLLPTIAVRAEIQTVVGIK